MWYDLNNALSKNRLYTFIIGNRGGGKTFACQKWAIKDYIKTRARDGEGKRFIWLRRYGSEVKEIKDKWCSSALMNEFPNNTITFRGAKIFVDGEEAGVIMALSTSLRVKSVSYDLYDKIIFDEFVIDVGSLRYIKDEAILFNEFAETVIRLRDDVRCVFIANAISIINPYFTFYNIKPDISKEFTLYQDICIHLYKSEEFIEVKKKTRFGRLNANNRYGQYAIDNAFLRDDYNFIKERPKELQYIMTVLYDREKYGCWWNKKDNEYYFDDIIEPKCNTILCVNVDELEEKALYKKSMHLKPRTEILKIYFNEGKIYFNDVVTKKAIYEVIKSI